MNIGAGASRLAAKIARTANRINRRRRPKRRVACDGQPVGPKLRVRRKRAWRKSQAAEGWITWLVMAALVLFFVRVLVATL